VDPRRSEEDDRILNALRFEPAQGLQILGKDAQRASVLAVEELRIHVRERLRVHAAIIGRDDVWHDRRAMTVEAWLESARQDARARGLPDLVPALEGLARATATLRAADWNDDASAPRRETGGSPAELPRDPHGR
jgi:hypothetical protein